MSQQEGRNAATTFDAAERPAEPATGWLKTAQQRALATFRAAFDTGSHTLKNAALYLAAQHVCLLSSAVLFGRLYASGIASGTPSTRLSPLFPHPGASRDHRRQV
jgi:hypothetical protein